jgi:glycolate oxidase FAD binding subunit
VNTLDVGRELSKHFDGSMLSRGRPRFDLDEIPLVAPDSIEGFVEAIRFAAREKLCIVPTGLGSKLGWCAPPTRADFMLSTRRFTGVVSHVPDDGTIAVRAGTTMADLARVVESGGHRLTPDVPRPERCTIGGVVAAGESGADRLRFGPVRHHVLGLKVLLADGTIAKCGGQLVKNVTGFDLMKLYTGSHGTLCVILEVALRLFPAPEREFFLASTIAPFESAQRALALPLRLASLSVVSPNHLLEHDEREWSVFARLFGRGEAVEAECKTLLDAWPTTAVLEGDEARAGAVALRDIGVESTNLPWLHAACRPSQIDDVLFSASYGSSGLKTAGDVDAEMPAVVQPGLATVSLQLHFDVKDLATHTRWTRDQLKRIGANVALLNAPSSELAYIDPLGDDVIGVELMRDLKRALDPNGVFASGRFVGGI